MPTANLIAIDGLSDAQRITVLAALKANPTWELIRASGDTFALLDLLNGANVPATNAWRTDVSAQEADTAPDYSGFDTIPAGKRESWGFFLNFNRDFTQDKVRKWIIDVWGAATPNSDSAAILNAGVEPATTAQVVLSGQNKTTGTVSALARNFAGQVTIADANYLINH